MALDELFRMKRQPQPYGMRHLVKTIVIPRSGALGLADPSLKLILKQLGFSNVVTMEEMEVLPVEGGEIVSVPFLSEHGDLNVLTKTSYLVRLDGRGVYCLADSNNIDPVMYERVRELVGHVDAMFIEQARRFLPWPRVGIRAAIRAERNHARVIYLAGFKTNFCFENVSTVLGLNGNTAGVTLRQSSNWSFQ
jgi:hypothetical protein